MAEYITKEQAKDAFFWFDDDLELLSGEQYTTIMSAWDREIDKLPPADVAPVIHAYWRGIWGDGYAETDDSNMEIVYEEFECSNCGCIHNADGEPEWDYCPECGCRMDGEENDEIFSSC